MKQLVLAICLLAPMFFDALAAGEADGFIGRWTAKENGQTISWVIAAGNAASFFKDGVRAGEASWVLNRDKTISIKTPPGNFVAKMVASGKLEITPPAAFNSPPSLFHKE